MRSRAVSCGILAILALAFLPATADGGAVLIPGSSEAPPVLARIDLGDGISALAITADGLQAAAARLSTEAKVQTTTIVFFNASGEAPKAITVQGEIRDLLFLAPENVLLGIVHRPRKKHESETYLVRFEPEQSRSRRVLRLPVSANDLEPWPARQSLIVASRNELRTFRLPDFRSAPLYRLSGNNLAASVLAGTDFVLIGRDSEIALVNLSDPPGRPDMPVRERFAIPAPVSSIASRPDGTSAMARLFDGRTMSVRFNPLRAEIAGTAAAVVSLSKESGRPTLSPRPEEVHLPHAPPPVAVKTATEPPAAPPEPEASPSPVVVKSPSAAPTSLAQLSGSLVGPARSLVKSVVLFGPNNILREARRITPDNEGRWSADGLSPGRYRLQLDGGGQRVLVSDPVTVFLDIEESGRLEAPQIQVLRAL